MSAWYRRGACARRQDILDFIEWVFQLQAREEHRSDPTVKWNRDMSWQEMGHDAVCMEPGDISPPNEIDQFIPGELGFLEAQLYWPALVPSAGFPRERES